MAGFNENSEQRIVVRRERDAAPVFELAGIGPAVPRTASGLAYCFNEAAAIAAE